MKIIRASLTFPFLFLFMLCFAARADELTRREWKIDGVAREALVHIPATAKTTAAPIIFAFHGHGGSMKNAAKMFGFENLWPEAIVVYMQGLNTPGNSPIRKGRSPAGKRRSATRAIAT